MNFYYEQYHSSDVHYNPREPYNNINPKLEENYTQGQTNLKEDYKVNNNEGEENVKITPLQPDTSPSDRTLCISNTSQTETNEEGKFPTDIHKDL